MKISSILTIVAIILAVLAPVVLGKDQQVAEIDDYVNRLKRQMGNFYAREIAEIENKKQAAITAFEVADKAPFSSMAAQAELSQEVIGLNGFDLEGYSLSSNSKSLQPGNQYNLDMGFEFQNRLKLAQKEFALARSRVAELKSDIIARHEAAIQKLKEQRDYALNVQLPELEHKLNSQPMEEQPSNEPGRVSAIVHSRDGGSVLIGGEIIYEGEKVNGAKVVEITPNGIRVDKNGQTRHLEIGQTL